MNERGAEMLIMGDTFSNTQNCDASIQIGLQNMNLRANSPAKSLWDFFERNLTNYQVSHETVTKFGGKMRLNLAFFFSNILTTVYHLPRRASGVATLCAPPK